MIVGLKKNIVIGLPMIDIPNHAYKRCLFKKQHKNSFLIEKSKRARQPLALARAHTHTYIYNYDEVKSLGHNKYILNFGEFILTNFILS